MNKKISLCFKTVSKKRYDGFIVSNPVNVTYLTGFRSADGYLLLTKDKVIYFTNFIYFNEAKKNTNWEVKACGKNLFKSVTDYIRHKKLKNIAFEGRDMPFAEYSFINDILIKKNIKLSPEVGIVEDLRIVKDKLEITKIKKAAAISFEAFKFIDEIYSLKMSERDIFIEVERFLKVRGDNEVAFSPIVAIDKNAAIPHHSASSHRVNKNGMLLIDLGAKYQAYCADLTRVFFLGKMHVHLKKIHDVVLKAHDLAIKSIKDGVRACDVDKVARSFIEKKGFGKFFGHGLGHGVGLCVHEGPYISPKNEQILKSGMVITIEPAIYLPNKFGVRLEDMVIVGSKKGEVISGNINN